MRLVLNEGSVFAGYRIVRLLGSGGMGAVYLAQHPDLPRREALKVLSAVLSRDREFRARFVREADVAAGLDHPNIVSVYQRGEFDGQLWIAMQFVDGLNAGEGQRIGPWSPARAVEVVGEVARGLDYAHRRGVVHRDIKPANFLLSGPESGEDRVLLGDFGIARALGDTALTSSDSVIATLAYAAPEILANQGGDHRADLYSLGASLFRLLTGRTPFPANGEGPGAVVAAHLFQDPPRVTDWVPGLSNRMDAVVATAMAKDLALRYNSARELAEAAAAALQDESTHSRTLDWAPTSVPAAPHQFGPGHQNGDAWSSSTAAARAFRRRIVAATVIGLVIAAAMIGVAVVVTNRRAPTPPSTPSPAAGALSTTSAAPPSPANVAPLPDSALPGLLLPVQQVADITGVVAMTNDGDASSGWNDESSHMGEGETDCAGPLAPAMRIVYAASPARAVWDQIVVAVDKQASAAQAVVAFPTADAARRFVADQVRSWKACSGRSVAYKAPGRPQQNWKFETVQRVKGDLAMTAELIGAPNGMQCQEALGARNNIVVDVGVCRPGVDNRGLELLNAISAKVAR